MREFWSEVLPDEVWAETPAELKRDAPTTIAMPPPIACCSLRSSGEAGNKMKALHWSPRKATELKAWLNLHGHVCDEANKRGCRCNTNQKKENRSHLCLWTLCC